MAKYYIESYNIKPQSFLRRINSIDNTYGNASEEYEIKLKRISFFGLRTNFITRTMSFPCGFNHQKELTKGRGYII